MSIRFKTPLRQTWSRSAIPLIIAVISYLLEYLVTNAISVFTQSHPSELQFIEDKQMGGEIVHTAYLLAIQRIKEASLHVYSSYTCFISTMLFLHILMETIALAKRHWMSRSMQLQDPSYKSSYNYLWDELSQLRLDCVVKKIMSFIFAIWLQYSIVYSLYIAFYAIICHCILYGQFSLLHRQKDELVEVSNQQEKMVQSLSPGLLVSLQAAMLEERKFAAGRMLSGDDTPDVLNIIGSCGIEDNQIAFISQVDETHVLLCSPQKMITIDISNHTSPKNITSVDIEIKGLGTLDIYSISPDLQTIIRGDEDKNVYITSMSDPQNSKKIKTDLSDMKDTISYWTFFPDSKAGLLGLKDLYHLEISTRIASKVLSFPSMTEIVSLVLSRDGQIVYLGLDNGFIQTPRYAIRFINATDYTSGVNYADFTLSDSPMSLAISSDANTLFVLTSSKLMVVDVSNPASPTAISSSGFLNEQLPASLILSSDGNTIIVQAKYGFMLYTEAIIDVSDPKDVVLAHSDILHSARVNCFSFDSELIFMATSDKFQITMALVNANLGAQLPFIPINLNVTTVYDNFTNPQSIAVASDSNSAYVACDQGLAIFAVSNQEEVTYNDTIPTNSTSTYKVVLSPDGEIAFVGVTDRILIISTQNKTILNSIPHQVVPNNADFVLLPDRMTLIKMETIPITYYDYPKALIYAVDCTDLMNPRSILLINETSSDSYSFATNGKIMITTNSSYVSMYDITDLDSMVLFYQDEIFQEDDHITSIVISSDNRTLVASRKTIETQYCQVDLYDLSDLPNFSFLSSLVTLDTAGVFYELILPVLSSKNSNIIFIFQNVYIVILDITDRMNPYIADYARFDSTYGNDIFFADLSKHSEFPILITGRDSLEIVTFDPQYAIYMPDLHFGRGEVQSQVIRVLKRNNIGKYTYLSQNYQFISFSFFESTYLKMDLTQSYPRLPDWITYDKAHNALTVKLTAKELIQIYNLYSALSTPIDMSEFNAIIATNATNDTNPVDLLTTLISLGYIDTSRYLTSSFNRDQPLILPSNYNSSEQAIRDILSTHYFESAIPISVQSSLYLEINSTSIMINSETQLPLSVSISLLAYSDSTMQRCQFVPEFISRLTPSFQKDYTVINMNGLLFELNDALQNIIINLDDDRIPCNGMLNIMDGLNPPLNQTVLNISDHFAKYTPPAFQTGIDFQEIINSSPLVYTGEYFAITLNPEIFTQENLELSLLSDDLKSWLTQTGMTLSGVPPEPSWPQFWSSKYKVELKISNDYKHLDTSFILEVHMSMGYYVKLLIKVLSAIGLWVYFYTIFNILGKKFYRHPRDWIFRIDEEVTPYNLYPIAFIRGELKECRFIIGKLKKIISKDLKVRSGSNIRLAEYFTDNQTYKLDTEKLAILVDEAILNLSSTERINVRRYIPGINCKKELIDQLIINTIVQNQLLTRHENETRKVFEKIKHRWTDLVQRDRSHLWHFSLDMAKLQEELESKGMRADSTLQTKSSEGSMMSIQASASDSQPSSNKGLKSKVNLASFDDNSMNITLANLRSLKTELMDNSKAEKSRPRDSSLINLDLLANALIAYAFKQQHLDVETLNVHVASKEKNSPVLLFTEHSK